MVLSGLALELGAGRLSSAQMLKPQAGDEADEALGCFGFHSSFARPNSGYRTEMRKKKESLQFCSKGEDVGMRLMRYDGFGYGMPCTFF